MVAIHCFCQLLRKEAIIRDKDSELNEQRNEIMALRSELSAIKRGNESAAKKVSRSIISGDDQKRERMETASVPMTAAPTASTKTVGDSHCDDEKDMMLEYAPWFEAIEIVHILNVTVRHRNVKQSDPAFATITIAVLQRFVE